MIIIIVIALIVAIFVLGYFNEMQARKAFVEKMMNDYGCENIRKYSNSEINAIKGYFNNHKEAFQIDDITYNDLDMWMVYKQINYCITSAGDEYLYYLLRTPFFNKNDLEDFENKISYLSADENARKELFEKLQSIGRTDKFSIYDYIKAFEKLDSFSIKKDIIGLLLYVPAIIICFINALLGVVLLIVVIAYNMLTYFKKRSDIAPYISSFAYIFRLTDSSRAIIEIKSDKLDEIEQLSKLINEFDKIKKNSFLLGKDGSGSPMEVLMSYIRMLTHVDFFKFKSMLDEISSLQAELDELISIIGKLDTYISIGQFREYLKEYTIPVLDKDVEGLDVKEIYHPLLKKPVKNDFATNKAVLLTGANASGKSTFLKSIALNAILAQTIHTVCASQYIGNYVKVITSLSLKDSITGGESYYMAEINSIKRILSECQKEGYVMAFVDEVLRGTNTIERIAASSAILRKIEKESYLIFAATHDIELTGILENIFTNYHFKEEFNDNDIIFSYKINEGKAKSRNAIKLLAINGYASDIYEEAAIMASRFEKEGIWTL